MNGDDRDLRNAFARLRDAESATVPRFRVDVPRRRAVPRIAFAAIALVLVVTIGFVARRSHERPAKPPSNVTLSTWRAPTDFLLRTPGRELVASTPRLTFNGGRS